MNHIATILCALPDRTLATFEHETNLNPEDEMMHTYISIEFWERNPVHAQAKDFKMLGIKGKAF